MKFDVAVGNPPYSVNAAYTKAKLLYTGFFKQSIQIANTSAMLLPYNPHRRPRHHYELMDEHVVDVSEDVHGAFKEQGVSSDIRIFIATSGKRHMPHPALVQDGSFYPLPERARLKPLYGPSDILTGGHVDHEGDTLPCIYTLTLAGPKWKQIERSLIRQWDYPVAQTEWVALLSKMINRPRKTKTMKCRNPGYTFTSNKIAVFECEDEADADELNDWLRSSEFQGMVEEGIAKLGSRRRDFIGEHIIPLLPSHRGTEA